MAGLSKAGQSSEYDTSEDGVSESVSSEGAIHFWEEQKKRPKRIGKIYARKPTRITAREAPRHYGTCVFDVDDRVTSYHRNGKNRRYGPVFLATSQAFLTSSRTSGPREVEVMEWFVRKVIPYLVCHRDMLTNGNRVMKSWTARRKRSHFGTKWTSPRTKKDPKSSVMYTRPRMTYLRPVHTQRPTQFLVSASGHCH